MRHLDMARSILGEENARGVVDLAYDAAEPCVKALLLARGGAYPRTHAGIARQFGSEVIKKGRADPELGRAPNRGFERRNKARYDAHAVLTLSDAPETLDLAEQLVALARREIDSTPS